MVFSGPASTGGLLRNVVLKLGLSVAVTLAVGVAVPAAHGRPPCVTASDPVALAALPAEAQTTFRQIRSGGPFAYSKDGIVFGNRERQLPAQARGYYREYTVRTPAARDRGARRIVCGGAQRTNPDACYYTADHYQSFHRIAE